MATFYNQATLSYNGNVTTSNLVTGELVEALTVTKNAVADSYRSGDTVTYVISMVNSGGTPLNDVTITDELGAYRSGNSDVTPLTYADNSARLYINGALQPAVVPAANAPNLVVSGIDIPANGNALLIYSANVNRFAPLAGGSVIDNVVTASAAALPSDVTASDTIAVSDEATLSISKSVSPGTVSENGELTYTFILQNTGNTAASAADNVAVSDLFNPRLAITSVTLNGTPLSETTDYTYDAASGQFNTVPGRITVPAATYTVSPDTGEIITAPGISVLTVTGTV